MLRKSRSASSRASTRKLQSTVVVDSDEEKENHPVTFSLANVSLDTTIECNESATGTYGCFFTPDESAWNNIVNYARDGLIVHSIIMEPDNRTIIEVRTDMRDWVSYMQNHGHPLGLKVFKSSRSAWVDEMRESNTIYGVLGEAYTTHVPFKSHGRDVIGFRLQVKEGLPLFDMRYKTKDPAKTHVRRELFVIPALACQESLSTWRPPPPTSGSRSRTGSLSTRTSSISLFEITDMVFDALNRLHDGGFAHMDIKPANIVYCPNTSPCVKLIDFGMAISIGPGASLKSKGNTPMFASPVLLKMDDTLPNDYHYNDAMIDGAIARLRDAHMGSYASTRRPTHADDLREIYKKHDMWGATLSMIYVYYRGFKIAGYMPEQLEAWVSRMEAAVMFTGAPQKRARSRSSATSSPPTKRVRELTFMRGGNKKPSKKA